MSKLGRLSSFTATFREGAQGVSVPGGRLFRNVTLIKAGLGNLADRHYYPAHVLKEAVEAGQFERLKAYADHPTRIDETIQPERTIRDMAGIYTNVRFVREGERKGRVVGDLKIFRPHKWLSDLVEDLTAAGAADKIGISINGAGDIAPREMKEAGGESVNEVLNFRKLHSADIVTEAGAGGGFQTLMESARNAHKGQSPMTKKVLLNKIAEAAASGDAAAVTSLTAKLAECDMPGKKKDKVQEKAKPKAKPETEDMEESDADAAAAETAAQAAAEGGDGEADETAEGADGAEADETDESDDEGDEEGDGEGDGEDVAEAAGAEPKSALREKFHRGTRVATAETREAKDAKGTPKSGKSSFVKPANSGPSGRQGGRRYAESDTVESLKETNARLLQENKTLTQRLALQERQRTARKVVAGIAGLSKDVQTDLAAKLVRECRTEAQMKQEAGFYSRLLEGAASRAVSDLTDEDVEVEGMPARFRESFSGPGDSPESILEECGLPIKQ